MFFTYIKKFFLSPYYLYKSIQSLKTSVNTPIVEEGEISQVSYKKLYEEEQMQVAVLNWRLKYNVEQHQREIQQITDSKDTELTNYKEETKHKIDSISEENRTLAKDKREMELKYKGIITQADTLAVQHCNDLIEIQKLTGEIKSLKEELNQANTVKAKLEAETVTLTNRLMEGQETIEASHQAYVKKYRYISPNESQALLQERDTLQKKVEEADKNRTLIKDEMNKVYKADVGISKKLVAYLEDLKQIERTTASLTDSLQEISDKKTETLVKLKEQKHEIDLLGVMDKKSKFSQKDIEELTERMKQVHQIENIIELATNQLKTISTEENIIKEKLRDQRILRAKRHDLIIEQISSWIHEKSNYYATYDIPLNDNDSLNNIVEKLKQSGKFPSSNKNDTDKVEYNFREYSEYVNQKNYNDEAVNRRLPEIIRYSKERELALVTVPKLTISKRQNLPKTTDEMKTEIMKQFNNKPIINAEQDKMNQMVMQALHYVHRPLPISKTNSIPIYYSRNVQMTNAQNVNNMNNNNYHPTNTNSTTNTSNAESIVD